MIVVRPLDLFYHAGNPTYNLFSRREFDSVHDAVIINPKTKAEIKGVVFKKGTEAIGHLTLSNLRYVYLADENNFQTNTNRPMTIVVGMKSHAGSLESLEYPLFDPDDNRRMRKVILYGTKVVDLVLV